MVRFIENRLKLHNYSGDCHQVALWLAQKLTGLSFAQLLTGNKILNREQNKQLEIWIMELVERAKPIQYILGSVPFGDLDIIVEAPILIPRPETEEWVLELIDFLKSKQRPLKILDLCTGSGCIALALAKNLSGSEIIGIDISAEALALAKKNKKNLGINNISFMYSDLVENLNEKEFDVIVANPPYISEGEWLQLDSVVKNWEDKHALVADDQGLALIKKIIQEASNYFKKDSLSLLVLEIGFAQAEEVYTFMRSYGYTDVKIKKDFSGLDRVVMGRYVAKKK